jgi:hypothetical protein
MLPGANTWAVEDFVTRTNPDGTKTYFFVASDNQRGIDVFSWTGRPNAGKGSNGGGSRTRVAGLLALVLVALPAAAVIGTRRRRR